jgi:regulator of cell morphogenesis and NO signaling
MGYISDFQRADHRKISELFDEYRRQRKIDAKKARQAFSDFTNRLLNHIDNEEEFLFPLFEKKTGVKRINSSSTSTLITDHARMRELIGNLKNMLDKNDRDIDDVEDHMAELLNTHDEEEVNIVYPWLDEVITEEEMMELNNRIKSSRKIF